MVFADGQLRNVDRLMLLGGAKVARLARQLFNIASRFGRRVVIAGAAFVVLSLSGWSSSAL